MTARRHAPMDTPLAPLPADSPWHVSPDANQAVLDLVHALSATGMPMGQAMDAARQTYGQDAVMATMEPLLKAGVPLDDGIMAILRDIGKDHPEQARRCLALAMASRAFVPWERGGNPGFFIEDCPWLEAFPYKKIRVHGTLKLDGCSTLTTLPERLTVLGDLWLTDCAALKKLPDHLYIKGSIMMTGCAALTQLPGNLWVGESVYMNNCPNWDGQFQMNTEIGLYIFTDESKHGVSLKNFRRNLR